MQTILTATAQNYGHLRSIDMKTAFFQGEKLNWNVFIKPPSESNCSPEYIWKLKKCVYSLSDESLKWYTRVKKFVTDSNSVISKIDPSLFIWCNIKQGVVGLMEIYVDDFLCTGDSDFIESLI